MCTTAPVVESSKGLRFGCWRAQYFDLKEQLDAANLNVYQNKWSEIYDFTPNKEAKDDSNWCAALAAIA
jgi:protein XRP2